MRISGASRLIGATISAGVLAGLGAVGFHYLADYIDDVVFTWVDAQKAISRLPFVLIVPTAGLFLIGLFLQKFPSSRIGGVREVLESLQHHEGRVPMVRLLNVIVSGLVLAVGPNVIVYDLNAFFASVRKNGLATGTSTLTADYLGGFYSLDGYYPGQTGQAAIANNMLQLLNSTYGTNFATVNLATVASGDPVLGFTPSLRKPASRAVAKDNEVKP
jgi:hypothetical protein